MKLNPTLKNILFILKTKGDKTATYLSGELGISSMGVRKHLLELEKQSFVISYKEAVGVGRPKLFWALTESARGFFPDTHAFITVEIIKSIESTLGSDALDKVIKDREAQTKSQYLKTLNKFKTLEGKVKALAQLRCEEGYMASFEKVASGEYILVENHCPICAAAKTCQGFCKSELNLFKSLFSKGVNVKRTSHLFSGSQRCTYKISSE